MRAFGPFYPAQLQEVINHAERMAERLARLRVEGDAAASAWLLGRVEEIETFVEHVAHEWRTLGLDPHAATRAVATYLEMLHDGMRVHFGDVSPRCCTSPLSVTSPAATPLSQTQPIPILVLRKRAMDGPEDTTSVDPVDVLSEWPT